jgi:ligand-binding sensor domain-containing protein
MDESGKSLQRPAQAAARPPGPQAVRDLMRHFLEQTDQDETLEWASFTTADGLPHNWIYDLFQDSAGRIWVGTWGGGLARYDRGGWTVYNRRHGLASNAVTCIREDAAHRIWVATDAGLNRLAGEGDRFVDAGLMGTSILNIHFDQSQRLWAGCWRAAWSGGGLHRFDGADWRSFSSADGLPSREILKVFEDSRGRIWVGTYEHGQGAGVGCWDGSSWRRYTREDGLIDDCVYSMFEDPDGRMWFGTINGVSILDGTTWYRLTTLDGLVNDRVYAMLIDAGRTMWFGTEGGVSRYDGTTWQSFTKQNGLVEDLVRAIMQDRDGDLWFGTYPYAHGKGGISRAGRPVNSLGIEDRARRYLSPGSDARRELNGPVAGT